MPGMSTAAVTSTDRLSFTLFMALIVHAALILGISFSANDRSHTSKTLEVTLASYKSDNTPDEADFIAQENQQGSGTEDEARMLTTNMEASFHTNQINQVSPQEQQASAPEKQQGKPHQITTTGDSPHKIRVEKTPSLSAHTDLPEGPQKTLLQRSLEIASLEAKLDSQRQLYARQPRVQRLTAASTMKANDAYYVNSWRRRIEDNGARNYPKEAEQCFNDCRLRLLVAINPDGTIYNLQVLESSGRKVLDDAAIRIVRQSSPFAPFSAEMRKNTDRLEIIRTWQFKGNRYLSEGF